MPFLVPTCDLTKTGSNPKSSIARKKSLRFWFRYLTNIYLKNMFEAFTPIQPNSTCRCGYNLNNSALYHPYSKDAINFTSTTIYYLQIIVRCREQLSHLLVISRYYTLLFMDLHVYYFYNT